MISYLSVSLLHGPNRDDKAAADAQDTGQLPERSHPALGCRKVMDHGYREHCVKTLVPKRQ